MKTTIFLTTVVVSSIAVFSFYFAPNSADKKLKTVKLDQSIKVLNFTSEKDVNTIVNVTAQILELKNILIVCTYLPPEESHLLGYISPEDGYYLIKIQPGLSEDMVLEVYVHELYHALQYESGRLTKLTYGFKYNEYTYVWNTDYWDRIFETEAFENEMRLKIEVSHKMNNPLEH